MTTKANAAGTTNYLVSQALAGGGQCYNRLPDCHVTLSAAASFNGPAWAYNTSTTYCGHPTSI